VTLKFEWAWESAPEVRAPELAATWARLRIDVAGVTATLVEERDSAHGIRKSIDVPTYPLAEWIAFHWWAILAPKARLADGDQSLMRAGERFAWPDLTLTAGSGYLSASLRRMDTPPYFVRFLSSIEAVVDLDATVDELGKFVDCPSS
jgi:hypothetical protein